jgi:glycosyltransferase involved in cell wall biosynthesis
MQEIKVSIITVCFNSAITIKETIESVLNQTFKNIEYIIIDGNSTDGTIEIVKSYANNISCFISEKDEGIYDAMNKGIKLASGDIIGLLNSDDTFYDNNVISDVVDNFGNESLIDGVYGNLIYISKENENKAVRKWTSKSYYKNYFEDGHVPPHPTLFLKKNVYVQAGFFDVKYKFAADYEFMFRVFKKNDFKFKHINRELVKMKLGGATNKNFKNIYKGNKEIICAWQQNGFKIPILLMPKRFLKRITQFFV